MLTIEIDEVFARVDMIFFYFETDRDIDPKFGMSVTSP